MRRFARLSIDICRGYHRSAMEGIDVDAMERRAEELLGRVPDWIWDGESVPVPVEEIADSCCGLLVRDVAEMAAAPGCPPLGEGQSLSGLLLPSRGEIWVNAAESREWPARRRFTIGHELGHWLMHQGRQTALFCRHGSVDAPESGGSQSVERPPLERIEEEANYFAAALLMPARLIRREYERPDRTFQSMCSAFSSSGAAMGRRLHQVI